MRSIAEKPVPQRAFSGFVRPRPPALQRQRRSADDRDASPPAPAGRSGHDFGSLRVLGGAPGAARTRLTIGTPGDPAEREAEAVAERVMRMPDEERPAAGATQRAGGPTLQRMCGECGEETRSREGKGGGGGAEEIDGHVASEMQTLQGGGSGLPESARAFFEPRFQHDFAGVRVHTDARAARLARSVDARAFTLGRDIVFGAGEYSPGTVEGKRLLAHELTHVVQQQGAQRRIQRLTITQHALTKGTCGGRDVQWVFSLDRPAPGDGYIVQQIDRNQLVNTCPDVRLGPPAPLPTFWEAWLVKKGDTVDWTTTRDSWTDGNTRPDRPGTNGVDFAGGVVKFFLKATTGDLGDFGVAPADPRSPWGPGKVPSSGALPSTASKPAWWDGTPAEGPAERSVFANWNCCDADRTKHSFDLQVKP